MRVAHFLKWATNADWHARFHAIEGLRRMEPVPGQATPALTNALQDEDPSVRIAAALGIQSLPSNMSDPSLGALSLEVLRTTKPKLTPNIFGED